MENEITGFQTITHMWKHCFDYKGTSGLKEYWIPFIIHACLGFAASIVAIVAMVCSALGAAKAIVVVVTIPAIIITVYLAFSVIPWISLTVRRLHDTGKSGWWTLLLLLVGIGTVIVLFFCSLSVGISAFRPSDNMEECVYGPPEYFENYDPSTNMGEEVYGPPEMFDTEDDMSTEDYDPEMNMEPVVYGPPEMMR